MPKRPSRVLIAGSGYVGQELAGRLLEEGRTVYALRRRPERSERLARSGSLPGELRLLSADVTDPATLRSLPREVDAVVYAVSASGSSDEAYRSAYVRGPSNLLDALDRAGADFERFLFVSSTAVYGVTDGSWVDEETRTEPAGFAGERLLEGEREVLSRARGGTAVRFAGIYGPGRTRLVEQVRKGKARCVEDGGDWTNRIHRDDCAGFLRHLIDVETLRSTYVGVDHEPADRCTVYRWIADRLGLPEPPVVPREATGRGLRTNKRCSNARLRDSGYALLYPSFREGYGEMLGLRKMPEG